VNFGGKKTNLGASPHDWGFAKKRDPSKARDQGLLVGRWMQEPEDPSRKYLAVVIRPTDFSHMTCDACCKAEARLCVCVCVIVCMSVCVCV
jgi:hypothetical protein